MKIKEDATAPNSTVSTGVTPGGQGSLDLPLKTKRVSASLMARRKYKPESLTESELSLIEGADILTCGPVSILISK